MNAIHDPKDARRRSAARLQESGLQRSEAVPLGAPSGALAGEDADDGAPQAAVKRTLRRTGRKPVRFEGWQLVEATGAASGGQIHYDLNVYRTLAGCVVVELVVRRHAADDQDLFRVHTFADLAEAAAWLEAYRCIDDLPVPPGLAASDTALPWAVLQAVQLRQRLERIETDYHALLSQVFMALDLADPAEPAAVAPPCPSD